MLESMPVFLRDSCLRLVILVLIIDCVTSFNAPLVPFGSEHEH